MIEQGLSLLSKGISWAAKNPSTTSAFMGGGAGYVFSGGSMTGAITGMVAGGLSSTGMSDKRFMSKVNGKMVAKERVTKWGTFSSPADAVMGSVAHNKFLLEKVSGKTHSDLIAASPFAIGGASRGALAGLGVGAVGIGLNSVFGGIRQSYGAHGGAPYGNTFSGMGNGTR